MLHGIRFLPLMMTVLLLGSVLRIPLTYSYYWLDQAGFIEQLCENKDRPELNCDGKCYLSQMLRAQAGEEENKTIPVLPWQELSLMFSRAFSWKFGIFEGSDSRVPDHTSNYTFQYTDRIFHPPLS